MIFRIFRIFGGFGIVIVGVIVEGINGGRRDERWVGTVGKKNDRGGGVVFVGGGEIPFSWS